MQRRTHVLKPACSRVGVSTRGRVARQPGYYGSTFCARCACYLPVGLNGEFVWLDDGKKVGA